MKIIQLGEPPKGTNNRHTRKRIRGPYKYWGGKFSSLLWILPQIETNHKIYVEHCLGSGVVFFNKKRHKHEIINDLDGNIANFFIHLKDCPDELAKAIGQLPTSRDIWDKFKVNQRKPYADKFQQAVEWYYVLCNSFAAHSNHFGRNLTGFNHQHTPNLVKFKLLSIRLKSVLIENRDIMTLLDETDSDDTIHYIDPPYMAEVMVSTDKYMYGLSHGDMLDKVFDLKGMVAVSSYDCPFYDKYPWDKKYTFITNASAVSQGSVREKQIECLYVKE